jgi:hypothetical protein
MSNESSLALRKHATSLTEKLTVYGPVVVTVCVLLVQTFFPSTVDKLPLSATTAILAGSIIFMIWHVEEVLNESTEAISRQEARLSELEATQERFLLAATTTTKDTLAAAFGRVCEERPRVGTLRVFAISSQQILSFFKFHTMTVEHCILLLRGFDSATTKNAAFIQQIKLVVADWTRLQKEGRIKKLEIRHYNFHPTEYEVIFDRDHLILGLYDSDPTDYSGVVVRDPIVMRGSTDSARMVITEFVERFDRFWSVCEQHHGPNTLDHL